MTTTTGTPPRCRRCDRRFDPHHRKHRARGLCNACWVAAHADGTRDHYPLVRTTVDNAARRRMEAEGVPTAVIALRLGVTTSAIRNARYLERRRGSAHNHTGV